MIDRVCDYFTNVRVEIGPLLPSSADSILDVGCGSGKTSLWLKEFHFKTARFLGIDANINALGVARTTGLEALEHDLNIPLTGIGRFDLILCLDVLEHLHNPEAILESLADMLTESGVVIISLPNVAHYSVSVPLLFRGRLQYRDFGILDRTHLRFFDESSSVELAHKCGLVVTSKMVTGIRGWKKRLFDRLTFGLFRMWLAEQFIFKAEPFGNECSGPWENASC